MAARIQVLLHCWLVTNEMLSFNQHLNHFGLKYKLIVNANRLAFAQLQQNYEENYGFGVTLVIKDFCLGLKGVY